MKRNRAELVKPLQPDLLFNNGFRAAIFDLDGVIVSTAQYHFNAWRQLAIKLGGDLPQEADQWLRGASREKSLEIMLQYSDIQLTQNKKVQLLKESTEQYKDFIEQMTPEFLLPGVHNYILNLRASGFKIALGSASKNSIRILERVQILDLFDAIVDANCVKYPKPNPQVFLQAARNLTIRPSQCIVFEDSINGINAARAAKMFVVGIGVPTNTAGVNIIVSGFDQL